MVDRWSSRSIQSPVQNTVYPFYQIDPQLSAHLSQNPVQSPVLSPLPSGTIPVHEQRIQLPAQTRQCSHPDCSPDECKNNFHSFHVIEVFTDLQTSVPQANQYPKQRPGLGHHDACEVPLQRLVANSELCLKQNN